MKLEHRDARNARKITFWMVGIAILIVIATCGVGVYFSAENTATRALERIAKEYYEEVLYPSFMNRSDSENLERIASLKNGVMGEVHLRQLLLYDGGKNASLKSVFNNQKYSCDTENTNVIYRPTAPYGIKDYTIEYQKDCKSKQ